MTRFFFYDFCLSKGLFCCDETPREKAAWGGKGLLKLLPPQHSPSWREINTGSHPRNLEAGTEAGAVEEQGALHCSAWLAHLIFLHIQEHQPGNDTAHSELGSPTSIINLKKKKCTADLPASRMMEAFAQLRFFFADILACIKEMPIRIMRCVSWKQQKGGHWFLIQSASLCLFIGDMRLLM